MLDKTGAGFPGNLWEKPLHRALNLVAAPFGESKDLPVRRVLMSLIRTVFGRERKLTAANIEAVRHLLREQPPHEIDQMVELLYKAPPIPIPEAIVEIRKLTGDEQHKMLRALLLLTFDCDRMDENRAMLLELAAGLGIGDAEFNQITEEISAQNQRRLRLLKSGAGILVAVIVLLVFILTATLLRSVIFGLIGAYIMLPVEKYFEKRLADPHHFLFRFFAAVGRMAAPLTRLSRELRRSPAPVISAAEALQNDRRARIARAVSLTGATLLFFTLLLLLGVGSLTVNYVSKLKSRTEVAVATVQPAARAIIADTEKSAAADTPAEERVALKTLEKFFQPVLNQLETLRRRFDAMPLVQATLSEIAKMLNDESAQRELVKMILQRTGGFFSFTAGVIGSVCNFLLDVLLTVFFFLLFLTKLAEFCSSDAGTGRQNEYLVRTVFNGNWLPGASEETINEAERIISEIVNKLKIWLRGYLTLVLVDATVYTTVFYLLKVPYFFILGPLAGCGILLPFIGPIASAALTLLVTLAVGGMETSTLQLLGIICAYLIYNGIIEQFILYPVVIGESLGLSTLETIIVVLLGAIFAGITGMILAIPAAAVLKYLVPQIYQLGALKKE